MNKKISKDWQDWIKVNIERGCDLEEIREILYKEGFNSKDIKQHTDLSRTNKELVHTAVVPKKDSLFHKDKTLFCYSQGVPEKEGKIVHMVLVLISYLTDQKYW